MRVQIRPTLTLFLVFLTVLAVTGPAGARPADGLRWRPCPEDRTAQCGTLAVPIDRSDPYSAKVSLAVARRPATGARIGTLVVNPGGPGGSGVDFVLGAEAFFSAKLLARFDLVGFDPRGVGRSNPVLCSGDLVAQAPSPLAGTARQFDAMIAYNRKLTADCRRRTGPVFDHADSAAGVADLEALRAALGDEKINYYAASYGTLLGEQYAQTYPHRIRAIALDSVMDHSRDTTGFLTSSTDSVQAAFGEFTAWCDRDRTCVLRGRDVRAIWRTLLARAARGQLTDPFDPGYRLTPYDLVNVAFVSFYDPQWYALAYFLKELADARPASRAARTAEPVENAFPAAFCSDWHLPITGWPDYRDRVAALAARAPDMQVSPLALTSVTGCLGGPAVRNPQRPLAPTRTGPMLLINARHDPSTPYAWAAGVADQLGPKAHLVTYEGWGHVVYGRTPCATSVVDDYLIGLAVPAAGKSCRGVVPDPFGVGKRARTLHW